MENFYDLEARVKKRAEKAIKREQFKMIDIPISIPIKIQREVAEINRLILIAQNYGATPEEIITTRDNIISMISELMRL